MSALAIVFPGQASQRVGMLSEFSNNSLFKETFSEASNILGYNLLNLIKRGPPQELNKTYRAQPAILVASIAIWRLWNKYGGQIPKFMAGHSLGEYSALVCSGVIDFCSAVKLVELRGALMQDVIAPNIGAMSAIVGLDENIVMSVCEKVKFHDQIVSLSVFNAPKQVVISGHKKIVEHVNIVCKKLGAKFTVMLPISIPSHCRLMIPMVEKFKKELEKIEFFDPIISVVNNVDVRVEKDIKNIKEALIRQIYTPVRWKEIIEYLVKYDVDILLEMGPGKVLGTIAKCITDDLLSISVNDFFSLRSAVNINRLR